jgi:hypothetical protein
MEVSGQLHKPAALPQVPLNRRLGGPQKQSGRREEEKNLTYAGTRTQAVLIPNELSQLRTT